LTRPAGGFVFATRNFLQKFESVLRSDGDFPVEIAEVRMAKDPLTTTANGCYIAALSESK
jgi:hypothetical protein